MKTNSLLIFIVLWLLFHANKTYCYMHLKEHNTYSFYNATKTINKDIQNIKVLRAKLTLVIYDNIHDLMQYKKNNFIMTKSILNQARVYLINISNNAKDHLPKIHHIAAIALIDSVLEQIKKIEVEWKNTMPKNNAELIHMLYNQFFIKEKKNTILNISELIKINKIEADPISKEDIVRISKFISKENLTDAINATNDICAIKNNIQHFLCIKFLPELKRSGAVYSYIQNLHYISNYLW